MPMKFANPTDLKYARMTMWVDQVITNLQIIENRLPADEFKEIREMLPEQFHLLRLMHNVATGKTVLQGWKTTPGEDSNIEGDN